MKEEGKKGSRKIKIGLIISVAAIVILAGSNAWFWVNQQSLSSEKNALQSAYNDYMAIHSHTNVEYDTLQSIYNNYIATHSHTDTEYGALQSAYDNYVAAHHHTDSEFDTLKSERDALKISKLTILSVFVDDVRSSGNPYLHVYGDVWNVGTDTAYNCRLHVMAYRGAVLALDTYIELGTIYGENKKHMDERIYYVGTALTGWYIFSLWG